MSLYSNAFKQGIMRIFTMPRLSLPLIITLGLTLAAVLTVVAVANTILFKPLPDINENNLYQVDVELAVNNELKVPFFSDPRRVASVKQAYGDDLQWGYISPDSSAITVADNDIIVTRFNATSGSPETLGLTLITGQVSSIENASEGIWISKSLWQSAFGGVSDLSQQMLRIEGNVYAVMGVYDDLTSMNSLSLSGQLSEQVWRFQNLADTLAEPDAIILNMGPVTFVRGNKSAVPTPAELEQWFVDYANNEITIERARQFLLSKPVTGKVENYRDAFIGNSQRLVVVMLFAVCSLLVMACLNLLNMFIAHYQTRSKEFAIQLCMGSTVRRLRALIFIENLPMFLLATLLGLLCTGWLIKILPVLAGDNLPLLDHIELDSSSLFIALAAIVLINTVFSVIALVYVDKTRLTESLSSSGKGTPGQQKQMVSKVLMILQLSLACVLLTCASLSVKDSYSAAYTELGYSLPNAYEVSMQITDEAWQASLQDFDQYRGSEWQQLKQGLTQRLSALNGQVFDMNGLPLTSNVSMNAFPDPETGDSIMIRPLLWSDNMLKAFDIDLLAGRDLSQADIDLPNVLISKSFAIARAGETQWQSIVGQELKMGEEADDIFKVVGVVEDTYPMPSGAFNVDAPEVYFTNPKRMGFNRLTAVVVLPEGQRLTLEDVAPLLTGMDPRLGELQVQSIQERWNTVTEATRLNMYIVICLAVLTVVLAAIGVSGLSQMTASQKRYELAVRMATGAKQRRLLQLLFSDSVWMLIIGLALGISSAVLSYQYLVDFFNSAPAFDWGVMVMINIMLALVMCVSVVIPGWMVIRKDPMRVLREL